MKFLVVLAVVVAAAAAAPAAGDKEAVVITNESNNIGVGDYQTRVQTSNGIASESQGTLINSGEKNVAVVVRGSNSYIGDDGKEYLTTYVADENGYRAQGDHIPKSP